ncbi:MAG: hypothetical protein ACRCTA_00840, partial [Bacilli bacterium]
KPYLQDKVYALDDLINDQTKDMIGLALNKDFYFKAELFDYLKEQFKLEQTIDLSFLKEYGFKIEDEYILKQEYSSLDTYFLSYIKRFDYLNLNTYSKYYTSNPYFNKALLTAQKDYDLIQYSPNCFISIGILKNALVDKEVINDFVEDSFKYVYSKYLSIDKLFIMKYSHRLMKLGFTKIFYESLFKYHKKVSSLNFKSYFFACHEKDFTISKYLQDIKATKDKKSYSKIANWIIKDFNIELSEDEVSAIINQSQTQNKKS